jgi:hypothetical protein
MGGEAGICRDRDAVFGEDEHEEAVDEDEEEPGACLPPSSSCCCCCCCCCCWLLLEPRAGMAMHADMAHGWKLLLL